MTTQPNPLPILQTRNYAPAILDLCDNLYFRQSLLEDYKTCPQMMLYKWILQLQESDTFFAAVMGTAGHEVVREMHETKNFNTPYVELSHAFLEHFEKAVKSSPVPPRIGVKYDTLIQQCNSVMPEYISMLTGYQKDELNSTVHLTIIEQPFAVELYDEFNRRFVFTGIIDQAGFYPDGVFALRDLKFRANNFRPGKIEAKLNLQLSIYAYGLKHGHPTCVNCRPQYTVDGQLLYTGACDTCKKKLGTPLWPKHTAGRCEIIWMRDYIIRKRDEFAKHIKTDEKEYNPSSGRQRKKTIINPKWEFGYKAGDRTGPGRIVTDRSSSVLLAHISDAVRLAGMIKDGRFYRKAGDHCNFWCKYSKPCVEMFESEVEDIDTSRLNEHLSTVDPFGDE